VQIVGLIIYVRRSIARYNNENNQLVKLCLTMLYRSERNECVEDTMTGR